VQPEFNFDSAADSIKPGAQAPAAAKNGIEAWRQQRRDEEAELARTLGLPIGREAEVWLAGGVRLRGKLLCAEEMLARSQLNAENARFTIGKIRFAFSEIESCVRLD